MATVAIEVQAYKLAYGYLEDWTAGKIHDECPELPYPDFICNHCGYVNKDDWKFKPCQRCGKARK